MIKKEKFKKEIFNFYEQKGRHYLPWRKDISSYRVLVSEVMLQQTQVERVIPFFENWMKHFPNFKKLAEAEISRVLALWKGLGYNRRALHLHRTAKIVVSDFHGKFPRDKKVIMNLPGIGTYTAGAMMNIAFNIWSPFVDTNIRRVFIHHFFPNQEKISDREILIKMEEVGYMGDARTWAYALMDYGAYLGKNLNKNPNKRSRHYIKQSKFIGSERQIRGKILEVLLDQEEYKISEGKLLEFLKKDGVWVLFWKTHASAKNRPQELFKNILLKMEKDGFLNLEKNIVFL